MIEIGPNLAQAIGAVASAAVMGLAMWLVWRG